jgi:uncharacterized protein (TIGR04255 family)
MPNYRRPPITEAVFGWSFADPIDQEVVTRARDRFLDEFPMVSDVGEFQVQVDAATQKASVSPQTQGYRLASLNDQVDIVAVTNSRFSVSRLAPYDGWDAFRGRAIRAWGKWKDIAGYRRISRIGVRYINRIDIPTADGRIDLSDYFALKLDIPQPPFPLLTTHTTQAIFQTTDFQITVHLAVVPPVLINHLSYALDFDFGRNVKVPQSDDEIWHLIDGVREQKNMLFEGSITDRTRALFT